MATILNETDLDVVLKQRQLVIESTIHVYTYIYVYINNLSKRKINGKYSNKY